MRSFELKTCKLRILVTIVVFFLAWGIFFYLNLFQESRMIVVDSPEKNEVIEAPFTISGKARGMWFFEGSFPIQILAEDGEELYLGYATALSEWMTEDYVEFRAEIEYLNTGNYKRGEIILKRDNPSGLPEHDMSYKLPVRFK